MFSFSFVTIYALSIFPKNVRFFLSFFFFYAVFNSVQVSFLLFFFFCLFPLSCRPFFLINKLLIHYFFKPYICFSLSLPKYNNYRFVNQTFSVIFFLLSASISTKAWLVSSHHFFIFTFSKHDNAILVSCLLPKMS